MLIGVVLIVVNRRFGLGLQVADIGAIALVVATYVVGQAGVDFVSKIDRILALAAEYIVLADENTE